jgi:hypothetical protein
MTETQARYYTNEALRRADENLDHAYNELLEARENGQLETEALEDEILGDEETFTRLSVLYARATMHGLTSDVSARGFLEFGVERLRRERTAEHSEAWEERLTNAEYWNWNDERV